MKHPLVIIGAGPTGLAVATLLAQHGVASTVVDRYAEPWPQPRAVHLDGESVRILQRIERLHHATLQQRPKLGVADVPAMLYLAVSCTRRT